MVDCFDCGCVVVEDAIEGCVDGASGCESKPRDHLSRFVTRNREVLLGIAKVFERHYLFWRGCCGVFVLLVDLVTWPTGKGSSSV